MMLASCKGNAVESRLCEMWDGSSNVKLNISNYLIQKQEWHLSGRSSIVRPIANNLKPSGNLCAVIIYANTSAGSWAEFRVGIKLHFDVSAADPSSEA